MLRLSLFMYPLNLVCCQHYALSTVCALQMAPVCQLQEIMEMDMRSEASSLVTSTTDTHVSIIINGVN